MNRVVALLTGAALVAACGSVDTAPSEPTPEATSPQQTPTSSPTPEPEPLYDPGQPGPWLTGVRTIELTDASRNRTFLVDLWYPVDPATPDGTPNTYELDTPLGTLFEVETPALRDATPAGGSFPLILFSHGFGGIRFQSYFFTEHLASHGFVVASPDHPGNRLFDFLQLGDDAAIAQSAVDRPLDILYVADHIPPDIPADLSRVGVSGHSFGGWTALEVTRRDETIQATFPLAPGFKEGATPDFVADLDRPIFLFGGSADGTTPFDSDQQVPYELAAEPKYLVRIEGAGHLDFSNLCEIPIAVLFVDDGCDPALIDPSVVHDRTNALATAFAYVSLAEDERYLELLVPETVEALGDVTYWAADDRLP